MSDHSEVGRGGVIVQILVSLNKYQKEFGKVIFRFKNYPKSKIVLTVNPTKSGQL